MKTLETALKELGTYVIEIGVFSAKTGRKETEELGVTNAELMYIHENGSYANNIPKRPVLQMTIDYARNELLEDAVKEAFLAYFRSGYERKEFEKPLKIMAMKMQSYARDIIYSNDGRLEKNARSTAIKKGEKALKKREIKKRYDSLEANRKEDYLYNVGNHPLFDTGQLARSITCQLVRK